MKTLEYLFSDKRLVFLFILLMMTISASIFYLNPSLDINNSPVSWPQLQMQFAYTAENGRAVLEGWGENSRARYLSVIWIDMVFAISYGVFGFFFFKKLGAHQFWCILPLIEMTSNLIETNMEVYWVYASTPENPMNALFFAHCILATIKWTIVPFYAFHMFYMLIRAFRFPELVIPSLSRT